MSRATLVWVTLTLKLPLASLPAPSSAEQLTVVSPMGKVLPEAGEQLTSTEPSLSSVATASNVIAAPEALVASSVMLAGRLSCGGVVWGTQLSRETNPLLWPSRR